MRSTARLLLALGLLGVSACSGGSPEPTEATIPADPGDERFIEVICGMPDDELRRVVNGVMQERSGDVQIVPQEPNTIGNWFSHSGPWDYLQEVPLFLYGPGQVPATGIVDAPATLADIAPTVAAHVGADFEAPDGRVLEGTRVDGAEPPRLVVVMVWDSAGRNVLDEHPDAWPVLKGLQSQGIWFDRAEIGLSPSISATVHATIGTGAWATHHGRVDHHYRFDGELVFVEETGPKDLAVPALADVYDAQRDNEPKIADVAFDNWHLGMIGHGSAFEGGDKDLVALRRPNGWGLAEVNRPFFELLPYAQDVPKPAPREVDAVDGEDDGRYFGQDLLGDEEFADMMAWSEWQTRLLAEMIRRDGFGADDVPDLIFTNYKQVDEVGHEWTMNSPQMAGALRGTDLATQRLIETLDAEVGAGQWVLAVTADHGSTPKVEVSGGYQIDERRLADDISATFDGDGDEKPVLQRLRPTQVFLDQVELSDNGFTLGQVAQYLAEYTQGDNATAPGAAAQGVADDPIFSAAFPTAVLEKAGCSRRAT